MKLDGYALRSVDWRVYLDMYIFLIWALSDSLLYDGFSRVRRIEVKI